MRNLVLGVVIEFFVGVGFAGLILALTIPLMNRSANVAANDVMARAIIIGVLGVSVAVALFRPGSAIRRHMKR
jgi:hypothetical protein